MTLPDCDRQAGTLASVRRAIVAGNTSVVEVVEEHLRRIEEVEQALRAWVHVDAAGALKVARAQDARFWAGEGLPRLAGTVLGVKDLFAVAGMPLTAGSRGMSIANPGEDAFIVGQLRDAGAIVLGMTATTAWAGSDEPATRNAHNRSHTPGGSSSGSAVAVAARMCAAALGTQTAGSILRPAAYNGVVGFKPSFGRLSRAGVVPDSWSIACPGFLTRTAQDAALLLAVAEQSATSSVPRTEMGRSRWAGTPWQVGVAEPLIADQGLSGIVRSEVRRALGLLEQSGSFSLKSMAIPSDWEAALAAHWIIMHAEVAANHQYLARSGNEAYPPHIRALVELGSSIPATAYLAAMKLKSRFSTELSRLMHPFDAVIAPVVSGPAPLLASYSAEHSQTKPQTGDHSLQMPWTLAGLPAISLPMGLSADRLPVGLQLIGNYGDDERLLAFAQDVERRLNYDYQPNS